MKAAQFPEKQKLYSIKRMHLNIYQLMVCKTYSGGYAYFETSYKAINRVFSSAALESGYNEPQRIAIIDNNNNKTDTKLSASGGQLSLFKETLISRPDETRTVIPNVAHLISPNITRGGPQGLCISFFYNIDGLSSDRLRILVRDIQSGENQTVWQSRMHSDGNWIKSEIAYSYNELHQVMFSDQFNPYRNRCMQ
ncbi:MAM domain-containing glycosylphosphatidylinositol anchor protein 2-like protein [Leptotrombidium deliense]|uniref:MAM domain-containing glycosylphosphatidylinositol anchor protein 2-like protein n=1 Tax=Leptotrombidium deliense TaxID=299467 RepID=A0A443SVC2_9ACAR|nr:MAM domain-containing glycosylphosphatidylinositol anchor protein 2-like protein [Leptotrombidium deliense]